MTAPAGTLTLTEFLTARLDEDEAVARSAIQAARPGEHWRWFDDETDEPARLDGEYEGGVSLRTVERFPARVEGWTLPAFIVQGTEIATPEQAGAFRHIARWDPARVLAEVEAKRRIVEAFLQREADSQHPRGEVFGYHATGLLIAIRLIASVYASHPDYREEWR